MAKGKFYIVATPIGNLKDITLRALDTLKAVDCIACEDTRVTAKLLEKYSISKKLVSYFKHNEKQKTHEIIELLNAGKSIALVSDAGTPCVCDPGCVLVDEVYRQGISAEIIPGASALTGFLSAVPRENEKFIFAGFLPRSEKQQAELFLKYNDVNLVFYESANRLLACLENLAKQRGKDTKVAVGRELTKIFEEIKIDTAQNIIEYYKSAILKGEIVVLVCADKNITPETKILEDNAAKLKAKNFSNKDIAVILSEIYNTNKNDIYDMLLKQSP